MSESSPKALAEDSVMETEVICNSALADWQKVDALNTFILTRASYLLSASTIDRTLCQHLDARVRRAVKKTMKLPKRAVSSFLYTGRQHGGLGLTSVEDTLDVTKANRLMRCLSSPDKKVQDVAWDQLAPVVRKRRGVDSIRDFDLQQFLISALARRECCKGDIRSLCRRASSPLKAATSTLSSWSHS